MIEINWKPSAKDLRQFSVAFLVAAAIVGSLAWWKWDARTVSYVLWGLGPIVAAVGLAFPRAIKPLFLLLTLLAFPIGFVIGHVLMALVFYLLLTPIALVFKLRGRDSLYRSFDREAPTYWIRRDPPVPPARYFRQF